MSTAPRIRALVVDDEPLARRRLRSMLATETELEVIGEAGTGSAAVEAIADMRPDLIFLDVQMPGLDGFQVLRCTAQAHRAAVVFVTAYDEHAIRAFDVHAVDYLVKPVTAARLHEAVRRAVARVRQAPRDEDASRIDRVLEDVAGREGTPDGARIPIRRKGAVDFVKVADVDWVEADGDHVKIHAARDVHVLRETLSRVAERLGGPGFARIHRRIIVNTARVRTLESGEGGAYTLVLAGGTRLPCGRKYRAAVQSLIRSETS
jgi:two-component system, LytTR family, response regulator